MTERVLITGGNGFIGKHLQKKLKAEGIPFFVFDLSLDNANDIRTIKRLNTAVDQFKATSIVHLAGMLGTHELSMAHRAEQAIDINIKGALNVGTVALEHGCRLVSIEQPHIWYNVYEASKLAARRMLTGMAFDKGLKVAFVTAHNAFGEDQAYGDGHPQKIIPTFAKKAWAAEKIPIWGDGQQKCNLVYAGHVAQVLHDAVTQPHKYCDPLKEYNAATNVLWSVDRIVQYVLDYVESAGGPKGMDFEDGQVEYKKMRRGEQPSAVYPTPDPFWPDLDLEALNRTIDWYRDN